MALCASFKDRPVECKNDDLQYLIDRSDYEGIDKLFEDHTERDLLIVGFFVILVNVGMVCIHKNTQRKETGAEIQMEVNQAVASYFALRGEETTEE